MPTERFYRLSKEKQIIIRDAAIGEFSRVPFEKVSINKIIQNAEISRGSFYTYFEDKRDLLAFIFHNIKQSAHEYCQKVIEENHGDLWDMMERLLDYTIDICTNNNLFKLSENLMMNPEVINWLELECIPPNRKKKHHELDDWLYKHVDKTMLKSDSWKHFDLLFGMSMAALFVSMAEFHKKGNSAEEVKRSFHLRLEIIKHGVCK